MTKQLLLNLIEANEIINKNKNILSIINYQSIEEIKNKKYWFPDIEELKDEFNILSKEIEESLTKITNAKNYIKNSNCNHEIRLEHYGLFGSHYKCIFCGKSIAGDNCVNWEYSNNRNKYSVSLVAKYQEDDDYGYISSGYTQEQCYELIIDLIKEKKDDEEIDLIKEFKKLNLSNCHINEEPKTRENYILIINGSNKQFIDQESYLYKKGLPIGINFLKYFSDLLNTKVELLDNDLILDPEMKKNYSLNYIKYDTINELEKILAKQKEIPFKLIIDISELYVYQIENNEFSKQQYNLNLNKYFPQSNMIKIANLSRKHQEELLEYLKSNEEIYGYQQDKYYYIDDDEIKSNNLENTCNKLKLLLKNK